MIVEFPESFMWRLSKIIDKKNWYIVDSSIKHLKSFNTHMSSICLERDNPEGTKFLLEHSYCIPFKVSHWWDGEKGRDSASHAIISYIVTQC
jgi:hypothetical protein